MDQLVQNIDDQLFSLVEKMCANFGLVHTMTFPHPSVEIKTWKRKGRLGKENDPLALTPIVVQEKRKDGVILFANQKAEKIPNFHNTQSRLFILKGEKQENKILVVSDIQAHGGL